MKSKKSLIGTKELKEKLNRRNSKAFKVLLILFVPLAVYSFIKPEAITPQMIEEARGRIHTLELREELYKEVRPNALGENRVLNTQENAKMVSLISSVNIGLDFKLPHYQKGQNFDEYDSNIIALINENYNRYRVVLGTSESPPPKDWPEIPDRVFLLLGLFSLLIQGYNKLVLTRHNFLMGYHGIEEPVEGTEET